MRRIHRSAQVVGATVSARGRVDLGHFGTSRTPEGGQTTRWKGCGLPAGTNKHNAGKLRCTRPSSEYPLVSVSALLRLAEWQLAQQALAQGGEPCQHSKRGGRGSSEPAGAHQDWPDATVGNAARGIAAADSNHAQSHRDAASATTFQAREGGDA